MSPLILIAYSLLSPSYRTAYGSAYPVDSFHPILYSLHGARRVMEVGGRRSTLRSLFEGPKDSKRTEKTFANDTHESHERYSGEKAACLSQLLGDDGRNGNVRRIGAKRLRTSRWYQTGIRNGQEPFPCP